jgi:hypothetical protein
MMVSCRGDNSGDGWLALHRPRRWLIDAPATFCALISEINSVLSQPGRGFCVSGNMGQPDTINI